MNCSRSTQQTHRHPTSHSATTAAQEIGLQQQAQHCAARAPNFPLHRLMLRAVCTQLTSCLHVSEPSSAPQPPTTPHQAGGSGLQLPATLKERCEINKQLSRAQEDAYLSSEGVGLSVGLHPVLLAP